ncbi:hypothetical protein PybrP1_005024 [[Pythium] brassicae (nom. inval.)]|nr:hypothetical protein PybrP1_005024 [[Pythium] brassicae (nom. inval.)]
MIDSALRREVCDYGDMCEVKRRTADLDVADYANPVFLSAPCLGAVDSSIRPVDVTSDVQQYGLEFVEIARHDGALGRNLLSYRSLSSSFMDAEPLAPATETEAERAVDTPEEHERAPDELEQHQRAPNVERDERAPDAEQDERQWLQLTSAVDVTTAAAGSSALDSDELRATSGPPTSEGGDEEEQAFTPQQLHVLAVNGVLSVVLFAALAAAVLWMTVVHFRGGSGRRKKAFHVALLVSIVLNIPDPLGWVLWPETESWVYTYVMRVYAVLLQSACKSYLALCWADVVSAGRSGARRRMLGLVLALNALLAAWAVAVPLILAPYPDDVYGQYDFMLSPMRAVVTYTGVSVVLAFGLLLFFQGMRLRVRLLQARGTVPPGSVEKSLVQLLLTVAVIATADVVRVVSVFCSSSIPFTPFNVTNSLVPTIFPTICMLYLMRRVPRAKKKLSDAAAAANGERFAAGASNHSNDPNSSHATLSRFLATGDSGGKRSSDVSDGYADGTAAFALASSRVSSIARLEHRDQTRPAPPLSPPFVWSSARGR